MFDGVKSSFILPILDPEWVVNQIMSAVRRDKAVVYLPRILGFVYILRGILPTWMWDWASRFIGINRTMDSFKGRGDQWALGQQKPNIN
jgi:all-trans-retinol dehydrogenase (NAD+)